MPRCVVLIDETEGLGRAFAEHLAAAGWRVASAAPERAAGLEPAADVAVIDGDLLDAAGVAALARRFAAAGRKTALVVLSRTPRSDGDAVLTKPVRLGTLIETVGRLAVRHPLPAPLVLIGSWRFDAKAGMLTDAAGGSVRLTAKEAAILTFLREAGGVVPRERLLAEIWGYAAGVSTHTLETHIYRLRRKLGAGSDGRALLATEAGGYRLCDRPGSAPAEAPVRDP